MGSFLSLPQNKTRKRVHCEMSQMEACKRMRMAADFDDNPRLIPILPDELSLQILARLPRICYLSMRSVSRRWKSALTSFELFQLRKELGTTEEWLYLLTKVEDEKLFWHAFDPLCNKWQRLPTMPMVLSEEESKKGLFGFHMWNVMGSSIKMVDIVRGWLGWKDACDRSLLSGCAVGSIDGCLYVSGGFSKASALKNVWRYDPRVNSWEEVGSMINARAYCKTGVLNNKLYVVGGVSRERGSFTPLCSAEVFDPYTGQWSEIPKMPFAQAIDLPIAFLADMLKPMATGMATYKGKLYVPQSLYSWPFFTDIGGEIYDPDMNSWSEMPTGMGDGWPAKLAGTKLGVVVNGKLYSLEPATSLMSGIIKMYGDDDDTWKIVSPRVRLCNFAESESPYLLAGILGKLHVITKNNNGNISILQANFEKDLCICASTSSSPPVINSNCEQPYCLAQREANFWNVIITKDFGGADLVNCQVLKL